MLTRQAMPQTASVGFDAEISSFSKGVEKEERKGKEKNKGKGESHSITEIIKYIFRTKI